MSGLILDAGALTRPLSPRESARLAAALSAGRALAGRMARHAGRITPGAAVPGSPRAQSAPMPGGTGPESSSA
jgi:hypothetical protein